MTSLKVYLCDLTHESVILVSDTIPVNIGFVGSYAKKIHGDLIDISLFKYPEDAIKTIKKEPPDVLALSNYSWNSLLSERVAEIAKQINPKVITVQGGPNFPHDPKQQLEFLKKRPNTNFYIMFEGEASFSNILDRILKYRKNEQELFDEPINGAVFIHPDKNKGLIKGLKTQERIKFLDDIPSPYLNGMLDKFFDGRLSPFTETNRGCPFKCSFCHTGNDYYQKVHMFSIERIQKEFEYIAEKASNHKNTILHIADVNFGMFPRDKQICKMLSDLKNKCNWPLTICGTTGKNNKERIIEATSILGDAFTVAMSVQSMDQRVLANINRSNIKLDHYTEVNKHLHKEGRSTSGEVIIGLPGETKESFMKGVQQVIDSGVSRIVIYTLMMLHGTEFKDIAYRHKYGMKGKYRIVPLNLGEYEGVKVFDYEEVCVENKDMSFVDYLYIRKFALITESIFNNGIFEAFFKYALAEGIKKSEFIFKILENIERAPTKIIKIFNEFTRETKDELWNSDTEMVKHYKQEKNFQKLIKGEAGGNLIYKYKSLNIVEAMNEWIKFLIHLLNELIVKKSNEYLKVSQEEMSLKTKEIEALGEYQKNITWKFLEESSDEAMNMKSDYDFEKWLKNIENSPLNKYHLTNPIDYNFVHTESQKAEKKDVFKRYGTDINALSKIVVRIRPENWLRTIKTKEIILDKKIDPKKSLARYSLSN